jgi:hypothetical protein
VLNKYLIHDGHVVELIVNGEDGLDKFRNGRFDVVIVDRAISTSLRVRPVSGFAWSVARAGNWHVGDVTIAGFEVRF